MKRFLLLGLGLGLLAGCNTPASQVVADVQSGTAAVENACNAAMPFVPLTIGIPTVGPFVAAGVQAGCATNAGIAKLAADPSSVQWLQQQQAIMQRALGNEATFVFADPSSAAWLDK